MTSRRILLLAVIATAAIANTGCDAARSMVSGGAGDTVFVGVAVGLTSPERYVDVYPGVQMALDELNAKRPKNRPVLALKKHVQGAKSAVDVAVAFRDDPDVVGVVGHTESDAAVDAAAIYGDKAGNGKNALVAVSPTAAATMVTRLNDWVFRVCPVGTQTARDLARFALDSLKVRKAAVIYRNDAFGKDFRRAFTYEFSVDGGDVVESDPFMEEIAEFEAYGQRIASKELQAVAMAANSGEAIRARRAMRAAGANPIMLGNNPPPPVTATSDPLDYKDYYFITLFDPAQPPTAEGVKFVQSWQQKNGTPPTHWPALAYDAAMLIGQAMHEVGTDRKDIRDWIAEIGRGKRAAYSGVTGRIAFNDQGDPVNKQALVRTIKIQ